MSVRLQKFLADAGVSSRREGERLMVAGRVQVNGAVAVELGTRIDPERDRVTVDGKPVRALARLYVGLFKPEGVVSTRADPEGRRTIMDLIPREWGHLYPVGRLDYDSEGLLLLTNDGELCLRLTHPRYGIRKVYRVSVAGFVTQESRRQILKGVFDEGEVLRAESIRVVASRPGFTQLEVVLSEGRNREVRRLLLSQGHKVQRLLRVQMGPIRLGRLHSGQWRVLDRAEVEALRVAVGLAEGKPGLGGEGDGPPGRPGRVGAEASSRGGHQGHQARRGGGMDREGRHERGGGGGSNRQREGKRGGEQVRWAPRRSKVDNRGLQPVRKPAGSIAGRKPRAGASKPRRGDGPPRVSRAPRGK